jgi:hypothetical protein
MTETEYMGTRYKTWIVYGFLNSLVKLKIIDNKVLINTNSQMVARLIDAYFGGPHGR